MCIPSGVKYTVPLSMAASGKYIPSDGRRVFRLISEAPSSHSRAVAPGPLSRLLLARLDRPVVWLPTTTHPQHSVSTDL